MRLFSIFVSIICFGCFFSRVTFAEDKLSLKEFAAKLKKGDEITQLYKTARGGLTSKKLLMVFLPNEKAARALMHAQSNSRPFVRGEIEDEKTLNAITQYLQLSLVRSRLRAEKKQWAGVKSLLNPWFVFAADFAYEEASLVGMHYCAVIRSLLFDELESFEKSSGESFASEKWARDWLKSLRAPWPIDRVILSEAKRILGDRGMGGAEKVAAELQKNSYQTGEAVLKSLNLADRKDLEFIKKLWSDDDIQLLKTELNRLGRLRLKFAQRAFVQKMKKEPASAQDLEKGGWIEKVPIDYFTGHPMSL